jgi:hypothetical protein
MKILKTEINEVVDDKGDLIGKNTTPENGANLETQANKTTDYNLKVGQQPFRYDMLGRFGFTLMPFMEGEENQGQSDMIKDLAELMREKDLQTLKYYYKNPNKMKSDYRKEVDSPSEIGEEEFEWAKRIAKVLQDHFEKSFDVPEQIDENTVSEDKVMEKIDKEFPAEKDDDKSVRDKKIKKIAGLIGKLEKEDVDTLITLIERKK